MNTIITNSSPPGSSELRPCAPQGAPSKNNAFEDVHREICNRGLTREPNHYHAESWSDLVRYTGRPAVHLIVHVPARNGSGKIESHKIATCTFEKQLRVARSLFRWRVDFAHLDRGVLVIVDHANSYAAGLRRFKKLERLFTT